MSTAGQAGGAGALHLSVGATCRVEFGAGRLAELPGLVASLGATRAFLVTDRGVRAAGIVGRAEAALATAGMEHACYDGIAPNPATTNVDEGAAMARRFGDAAVVAIGGGSVLDAAKGIALLAADPDARAADAAALWTGAAGRTVLAVPTTSGTGAETNGFGVIEDTCARRKVYLGHPSVTPRIALLDPELTLGLPAHVTAATGIDALVHGIESLASLGANPISAAYATQAVATVSRWLGPAYRDGNDLDARAQLMLGAHLAGRALTISGLGLVHGIGHALTAHAGAPHGVALAAVLEEVLDFNAPSALPAFEQAARAMRVAPAAASSGGDWARAAIDAVREISGAIDVKRPLRDLKVKRDMLPAIAEGALLDAVTGNTPRPPTGADVLGILESVY